MIAAAVLAPVAVFTTSGVANAAIVGHCAGSNNCSVQEDMGSGVCGASIWQTDSAGNTDPSGTFAQAFFGNTTTGYDCRAWIERDVNNTGWYQVSGTYVLPPTDSSDQTGNYFDGGGYQARACIQFDWGSSLGAVHCSPAIGYIG